MRILPVTAAAIVGVAGLALALPVPVAVQHAEHASAATASDRLSAEIAEIASRRGPSSYEDAPGQFNWQLLKAADKHGWGVVEIHRWLELNALGVLDSRDAVCAFDHELQPIADPRVQTVADNLAVHKWAGSDSERLVALGLAPLAFPVIPAGWNGKPQTGFGGHPQTSITPATVGEGGQPCVLAIYTPGYTYVGREGELVVCAYAAHHNGVGSVKLACESASRLDWASMTYGFDADTDTWCWRARILPKAGTSGIADWAVVAAPASDGVEKVGGSCMADGRAFLVARPNVSDASWYGSGSRALLSVGAFAHAQAGDRVVIRGWTGGTAGTFTIESVSSADGVVLVADAAQPASLVLNTVRIDYIYRQNLTPKTYYDNTVHGHGGLTTLDGNATLAGKLHTWYVDSRLTAGSGAGTSANPYGSVRDALTALHGVLDADPDARGRILLRADRDHPVLVRQGALTLDTAGVRPMPTCWTVIEPDVGYGGRNGHATSRVSIQPESSTPGAPERTSLNARVCKTLYRGVTIDADMVTQISLSNTEPKSNAGVTVHSVWLDYCRITSETDDGRNTLRPGGVPPGVLFGTPVWVCRLIRMTNGVIEENHNGAKYCGVVGNVRVHGIAADCLGQNVSAWNVTCRDTDSAYLRTPVHEFTLYYDGSNANPTAQKTGTQLGSDCSLILATDSGTDVTVDLDAAVNDWDLVISEINDHPDWRATYSTDARRGVNNCTCMEDSGAPSAGAWGPVSVSAPYRVDSWIDVHADFVHHFPDANRYIWNVLMRNLSVVVEVNAADIQLLFHDSNQSIFIGIPNFEHVCYENVFAVDLDTSIPSTTFWGTNTNVLLRHCAILGQNFNLTTSAINPYVSTDCRYEHSIFEKIVGVVNPVGTTWNNNHYFEHTLDGPDAYPAGDANATCFGTWDELFESVDPSGQDAFRPKALGVLANRVQTIVVAHDDQGNEISATDSGGQVKSAIGPRQLRHEMGLSSLIWNSQSGTVDIGFVRTRAGTAKFNPADDARSRVVARAVMPS